MNMMIIDGKKFENDTYIMGILNMTPDSFSDGGKWNSLDAALKHTEQMIRDGAAVIDVGGESTRPGYAPVSEAEETERVVPVIEAIKKRFDVPVSIDTYRSGTADAALSAGAAMINDIWGFRRDPLMAEVCKKHDAACCLVHNSDKNEYDRFPRDVLNDLTKSLVIAVSAGIGFNKICVDPGIGFAKSLEENLYLTQNVNILKELRVPILLGTSRKSMIGLTLGLPTEERLEGTLVTSVIAAQRGCLFVRVHDVKENYRAIKMTRALMKYAD